MAENSKSNIQKPTHSLSEKSTKLLPKSCEAVQLKKTTAPGLTVEKSKMSELLTMLTNPWTALKALKTSIFSTESQPLDILKPTTVRNSSNNPASSVKKPVPLATNPMVTRVPIMQKPAFNSRNIRTSQLSRCTKQSHSKKTRKTPKPISASNPVSHHKSEITKPCFTLESATVSELSSLSQPSRKSAIQRKSLFSSETSQMPQSATSSKYSYPESRTTQQLSESSLYQSNSDSELSTSSTSWTSMFSRSPSFSTDPEYLTSSLISNSQSTSSYPSTESTFAAFQKPCAVEGILSKKDIWIINAMLNSKFSSYLKWKSGQNKQH